MLRHFWLYTVLLNVDSSVGFRLVAITLTNLQVAACGARLKSGV